MDREAGEKFNNDSEGTFKDMQTDMILEVSSTGYGYEYLQQEKTNKEKNKKPENQ